MWFRRFILFFTVIYPIVFFGIYGYFLLQVSDVEFGKEGSFTDEDIEVIKQIPGVTFVRRLDHHIMVGIRTYRIPKVRHEIWEKTEGHLNPNVAFGGLSMNEAFGLILFGSIIYALPIALIFSLILLGLWYASTKSRLEIKLRV